MAFSASSPFGSMFVQHCVRLFSWFRLVLRQKCIWHPVRVPFWIVVAGDYFTRSECKSYLNPFWLPFTTHRGNVGFILRIAGPYTAQSSHLNEWNQCKYVFLIHRHQLLLVAKALKSSSKQVEAICGYHSPHQSTRAWHQNWNFKFAQHQFLKRL